MTTLYSMQEVSSLVGIDKSNLLKLLKKLGFEIVKKRSADTGNQLCSFVSEETLNLLKEHRKDFDKGVSSFKQLVYIVIPDESARPNRVKIGQSSRFESRLASYKSVCPELKVLRTYELDKSMEQVFIAIASSVGSRIGIEVFDLNVEEFLGRCDKVVAALTN